MRVEPCGVPLLMGDGVVHPPTDCGMEWSPEWGMKKTSTLFKYPLAHPAEIWYNRWRHGAKALQPTNRTRKEQKMSKRLKSINGHSVANALGYVFDGCHKFYIVEDNEDMETVKREWMPDEVILPLDESMVEAFRKSCPFRFVMNWKLDAEIVPQSAVKVVFEYEDGSTEVWKEYAV